MGQYIKPKVKSNGGDMQKVGQIDGKVAEKSRKIHPFFWVWTHSFNFEGIATRISLPFGPGIVKTGRSNRFS